jgi:hypothetical protein
VRTARATGETPLDRASPEKATRWESQGLAEATDAIVRRRHAEACHTRLPSSLLFLVASCAAEAHDHEATERATFEIGCPIRFIPADRGRTRADNAFEACPDGQFQDYWQTFIE